jgi:hypothetical protein
MFRPCCERSTLNVGKIVEFLPALRSPVHGQIPAYVCALLFFLHLRLLSLVIVVSYYCTTVQQVPTTYYVLYSHSSFFKDSLRKSLSEATPIIVTFCWLANYAAFSHLVDCSSSASARRISIGSCIQDVAVVLVRTTNITRSYSCV